MRQPPEFGIMGSQGGAPGSPARNREFLNRKLIREERGQVRKRGMKAPKRSRIFI